MPKKPYKLFFVIVLAISFIVFIINQNIDQKDILDNYDKVEAEITTVLRSGQGAKMTTLITVKYEHKNTPYSNNLRRTGYKEGLYNKGDKITIYINPNDDNDIK